MAWHTGRTTEIKELVKSGATLEEMGEVFEVTREAVRLRLEQLDPDHSLRRRGRKQRSEDYREARQERNNKCPQCGGHKSSQSKRCATCAGLRKYNIEMLTDLLLDFYKENGRGPTAGELGAGIDAPKKLPNWPHYNTFMWHFKVKNLNDMFRLVGIPIHPQGHYVINPRPGDLD